MGGLSRHRSLRLVTGAIPAAARASRQGSHAHWAVSTGRGDASDLGGCDGGEGTALGPGVAGRCARPGGRRWRGGRIWPGSRAAIAAGRTSEGAARGAGPSPPVGVRWFRRSGGMPPTHPSVSAGPLSGRHLSFAEREEIALLRRSRPRRARHRPATRHGGVEHPASSRAVARPVAPRGVRSPRSPRPTRPFGATFGSGGRARSPPPAAQRSLGRPYRGKGPRHGPRQARRWAAAWGPEQIAREVGRSAFPRTRPCASATRPSDLGASRPGTWHGSRRGSTACLRTGRALRVPRARRARRGQPFVTSQITIGERPAEALDRAVPGHGKRDPIGGAGRLGNRHAGRARGPLP